MEAEHRPAHPLTRLWLGLNLVAVPGLALLVVSAFSTSSLLHGVGRLVLLANAAFQAFATWRFIRDAARGRIWFRAAAAVNVLQGLVAIGGLIFLVSAGAVAVTEIVVLAVLAIGVIAWLVVWGRVLMNRAGARGQPPR